MRIWYLSHRRAAKVQTRLHIPAVWPEPLLLTYASLYVDVALLDMSAWVFNGGFCVHVTG